MCHLKMKRDQNKTEHTFNFGTREGHEGEFLSLRTSKSVQRVPGRPALYNHISLKNKIQRNQQH